MQWTGVFRPVFGEGLCRMWISLGVERGEPTFEQKLDINVQSHLVLLPENKGKEEATHLN